MYKGEDFGKYLQQVIKINYFVGLLVRKGLLFHQQDYAKRPNKNFSRH